MKKTKQDLIDDYVKAHPPLIHNFDQGFLVYEIRTNVRTAIANFGDREPHIANALQNIDKFKPKSVFNLELKKSTAQIYSKYKNATPPPKPTIDPIKIMSETKSIEITGEVGSTFFVIVNEEVHETGIMASPQLVTLPNLKGGEKIEVYLVDESYNQSDSVLFTVGDNTAPELPITSPVKIGSEMTTFEIIGEDNTTYHVLVDEVEHKTGIVTSPQSVTLPTLQGGEKVEIYLVDNAGNQSDSLTLIVLDETAPDKPTMSPSAINSKTGSIVITGENDTTYTVMVDTDVVKTGNLKSPQTVALSPLVGGEKVEVYLVDLAGNQSESIKVNVADVTAPNKPTSVPSSINSKTTSIAISGENGSKFTVNIDGSVHETGILASPHTITLPILNGGEKVNVSLEDTAKNKSAVLTMTVADVTAPETPTVDPMIIDTETASISITGEDGATFMVKVDTVEHDSGILTSPQTVTLPTLKGGEKVEVYLVDGSDNQSDSINITVDIVEVEEEEEEVEEE